MSSGITALAAGAAHTCARLEFLAARCWGSNRSGQAGDGTRTDRLTPVWIGNPEEDPPVVKSITTGAFHTCIILVLFEVQCWGSNSFGQLGDGTTVDRLMPEAIVIHASTVETGDSHTCAVNGNETLCWGDNGAGQLGSGNPGYVFPPVDVAVPRSVIHVPGLVTP